MVGGGSRLCPHFFQVAVSPCKNGFAGLKGVDLFHAKILFYICTGANGFYFDVYAFFLIIGGQ